MTRIRAVGIVATLLYVGTIFAANWAISTFGAVPVGFGLKAPAGVFFAGLALTMRDVVQDLLGRRVVIAAILIGAACSALVAGSLALASGIAFLASELVDFTIYTPLRQRGRWIVALISSNTVGVVFDSVLFLYLAFGSLAFLPGQLVGKTWVTLASIPLFWAVRKLRHALLARDTSPVVVEAS